MARLPQPARPAAWQPSPARIEGDRLLKAREAQQRIHDAEIQARAHAMHVEEMAAQKLDEKVEDLTDQLDRLRDDIPKIMPGMGSGKKTIRKVLERDYPDIVVMEGLSKDDGNFLVADGASWTVESGATARTSLGLGTSAVKNIGTSGDVVVQPNAANTFTASQSFAEGALPISSRAYAIATWRPREFPDFVITEGYAASGDLGRAHYKKVGSEPTHSGKWQATSVTGATAWYEMAEIVVRPEMFGASRVKTVDSATALQAMVSYVNATNAAIACSAIYRSTSPFDLTCSSLVIQGSTSRLSGFVFEGCDGIRLDQSALSSFVRYDITNICVLASSQNLYKGFKYTGQASSGGGHTMRRIEGCHFAGEGFFDFSGDVISQSLEVRNSGWLVSMELTDSDNTHVTNCRIHGAWQQWMNNNSVTNPKFGAEAVAIRAHNTTALFIEETQIQYVCWGVLGSGQSEGIVFEHGGITACGYGITVRDTSGAANNCKCIDSHLSCYWGCVDYGTTGSGAYMMHFIKGNLMFLFPGTSADNVLDGEPFRFVKGNMTRSHIIDNHFYVTPPDDAASLGVIAIEIAGSSCVINGNIFQGCSDIIHLLSGSSQNIIALNYTTTSEAGYALLDDGTGTSCYLNSGDKRDDWPAAIYKALGEMDLWAAASSFGVFGGSTKYKKFGAPDVSGTPVNWLDFYASATNGPVSIRSDGSDTNVGIRFVPKGDAGVRIKADILVSPTYTMVAADCGRTLTNEGATGLTVYELMTAAPGMCCGFYVQDADGIRIRPGSGDTIRIAASESGIGSLGRIDNATVGSYVWLVAVNATEWIATTTVGTWTVT